MIASVQRNTNKKFTLNAAAKYRIGDDEKSNTTQNMEKRKENDLMLKNTPLLSLGRREVSWGQFVQDFDFGIRKSKSEYGLFERLITNFDKDTKKAKDLKGFRDTLKKEMPASHLFKQREYIHLSD